MRESFKHITFSFVLCILLLGIPPALAQENPEEMAKKYNIQFPIPDLGNCGSFTACKAYCDDEANRDSCMTFAKKKGFYQEAQSEKSASLLQNAKSELGCDSETTCRQVCEQEANFEKCSAFAQKHNLGGPRGNPGDKQILQKAKELLGCNSESSCKTVCENPSNQEKCSTFAKQTGLGGGIKRVGPGGCNSEESCNAYCQSHPDECQGFGGQKLQGQQLETFCRENPERCRLGNNEDTTINQDEFCRQNPDKCKAPSRAAQYYDESQKSPGYQEYRSPEGQYTPPEQYQSPERFPQEQRNDTYTQEQPPTEQQSVQGVTTKLSLFQRLFNFLLNK